MLSAALGVMVEDQPSEPTTLPAHEFGESAENTASDPFGDAPGEVDLYGGMEGLDNDPEPDSDPITEAAPSPVMTPEIASETESTPASESLPPVSFTDLPAPSVPVSDPDADHGSGAEEMLAAGLGAPAPPAGDATTENDVTNSEENFNQNHTDEHTGSADFSFFTAFAISESVVTWLGGTGLWNDGTKWSTGIAPTADQHVVIDTAGTFTITLSASATVASLTVGGSGSAPTLSISSGHSLTVTGDAQIRAGATLSLFGSAFTSATGTVAGTLNHFAGSLGGSGELVVTSTGFYNNGNSGTKTLSRTLRNQGTAQWTAGTWVLRNGAFINEGTTTFTVGFVTLAGFSASEAGAFTNSGTFIYNPSDSASTLTFGSNLTFASTGTMRVSNGIVIHNAAYAYSGAIEVAQTSTLRLNASGFYSLSLTSLTGGGVLDVRQGSVSIDSGATLGQIQVDAAGSVSFAGSITAALINASGTLSTLGDGTIGQIDLNGTASVTINDTLTVTGILRFNSGDSILATTSLVLGAASRLIAISGGTKTLLASSVLVGGEFSLSGTTLLGSNNSTWRFLPGSVVTFSNTSAFRPFGTGNPLTLLNEGAFTVTGSTSTTVTLLNVVFTNVGTFRVTSGVIDIQRAFTQTAGLTEVAGGRINATVGSFSLEGGELRGTGLFTGAVINSATVRPGRIDGTLGELTITGNYTQTAAGRLVIDALGLNETDLLGSLRVNGTPTLAGVIELVLLPGFASRAGDVIQVLRAFFNAPVGAFDTALGFSAPGYVFELTPSTNGYTLRSPVAPAPTTRLWSGAGDGESLFDPLNWAGGVAPSRLDVAEVAPVADLVLASPLQPFRARALVLGGDTGRVTFELEAGVLLLASSNGGDTSRPFGLVVRPDSTFISRGGVLNGALVNEGEVRSFGGSFQGPVLNDGLFLVRNGNALTRWGNFTHQQRGELRFSSPIDEGGFYGLEIVSSLENHGLFLIEAGRSPGLTLRTSINSRLTFTNQEGGRVVLEANLFSPFVSIFQNFGTWVQRDASFQHNAVTNGFFNYGRMDLLGSSSLAIFGSSLGNQFVNGGDLLVEADASLFTSTANLSAGRAQIDGVLSATTVFIGTAFVGGVGSIDGAVTHFGGVLAPGARPLSATPSAPREPGVLTLTGSYTQQAPARLELRLFASTPGEGPALSDRLVVGSATFAGSLAVIGLPGASAATLTLVERAGVAALAGAFARIETSGFALGTVVTPVFAASSVTLTVADAPAGLFTWAGGDGLWTDAANWIGGIAPGAGAHVAIGAGLVTLPTGASFTLASLELGGGSLVGAGTLIVTGTLRWWAGSLADSIVLDTVGATALLAAQRQVDFGGLRLADAARLRLSDLGSLDHGLTLDIKRGSPVLALHAANQTLSSNLVFALAPGADFTLANYGELTLADFFNFPEIIFVNHGTTNSFSSSFLRLEQRAGVWRGGFSALNTVEGVQVYGGIYDVDTTVNGPGVFASGGSVRLTRSVTIDGALQLGAASTLLVRSPEFSFGFASRAGVGSLTIASGVGLVYERHPSVASWNDFLRQPTDFLLAPIGTVQGTFTTATLAPADTGLIARLSRLTDASGERFLLVVEAESRSITWVGGEAGDWFDVANWDLNSLPTYADSVTINGATVQLGDFTSIEVGQLFLTDTVLRGLFSNLTFGTHAEFQDVVLSSVSLSNDSDFSGQLTVTGGLALDDSSGINLDGLLVLQDATVTSNQGASINGSYSIHFEGSSVTVAPEVSLSTFSGFDSHIINAPEITVGNLYAAAGFGFNRSATINGELTALGFSTVAPGAVVNINGGFTLEGLIEFQADTLAGQTRIGRLIVEGNVLLSGDVQVGAFGPLSFTSPAFFTLIQGTGGSVGLASTGVVGLPDTQTGVVTTSDFGVFLTLTSGPVVPDDLSELIDDLNQGLAALASRLGLWLGEFDFSPGFFDLLPADLGTRLGLADLDDLLPVGPLNTNLPDAAALAAALRALGFELDYLLDGLPDVPAAPGADAIQVRFDLVVTLGGGGVSTELDLASGLLLAGLVAELDPLFANLTGQLTIALIFGVDANGFYLDSASELLLTAALAAPALALTTAVGGVGEVAFTGSLAATAAFRLAPTAAGRLRAASLALSVDEVLNRTGTVALDSTLAFALENLAATYRLELDSTLSGVALTTTATASLTGTITLPGLKVNDAPALIVFTAAREGAGWRITAAPGPDLDLEFNTFRIADLVVSLFVSSSAYSGTATGRLVIDGNADLGLVELDLVITFAPGSFTASGSATLANLRVGDALNPLAWIQAPQIGYTFSLIGGVATGGDLTFATVRLVLFPDPATLAAAAPEGVFVAGEVEGTLTAAGRLQLTADNLTGNLGGLAIEALGDGDTPALALDLNPSAAAPDALIATLVGLRFSPALALGLGFIAVGQVQLRRNGFSLNATREDDDETGASFGAPVLVEFRGLRLDLALTFTRGAAEPLTGSFTFTATGAAVFPDLVTPALDGTALLTGIVGSIDLATGALAFTAATFRLEVGDALMLEAAGDPLAAEPAIALTWDPADLDPSATLLVVRQLTAALPGLVDAATPLPVIESLTVRRDGLTLSASLTFAPGTAFTFGQPVLVRVLAQVVTLDLAITYAGTATVEDATLGLAAASAEFIAAPGLSVTLGDDDSSDALPGVTAALELVSGDFTLAARRVEIVFGGVIDVTVTGSFSDVGGDLIYVPAVALAYDATAPPAQGLLAFGPLTARLSALERGGLAPEVLLIGLRVNHGGDWALNSATVTLPVGFADVFELGIIPFRLESIGLSFPVPGDFDGIVITVGGTFALPELNLGFDPVIYLGLPELIGTGDPSVLEFRLGSLAPINFALDLGRLRLGEFAPFELPALSLGIEGLVLGGLTFDGLLSFGPFVNGQLIRLPGFAFDAFGFLRVTGGDADLFGFEIDLGANFSFPSLGRIDLSFSLDLELTSEQGGGRLELSLDFNYLRLPSAPWFDLSFTGSLDRLTLTDLVIEIPGFLRLTIPSFTLVINPSAGDPFAIGLGVRLDFLAFPDIGPITFDGLELYGSLGDVTGFVIRNLLQDLPRFELSQPDGPVLVLLVNPRLNIALLDYRTDLPLGAIGFEANAVILLPEADPATFTARGDSTSAGAREVVGGIDLATRALFLEAPRFSATFGSALAITGTGLRIDYDPANVSADATLATVATATARATDFPDLPVASLTGLFLTRSAVGFESLVFSGGNVSAGSGVVFTDLALTFATVRYTYATGVLTGTATLSAASASLFAGATGFSATLTSIAGTLDLAVGIDSLTFTAATLVADLAHGRLRLTAADLVFNFSGSVIAQIATASLSLPDLPDVGPATINGLQITRTGFSILSVVFGPTQADFGALRLNNLTLTLTDLVFDSAAGVTAGTLTYAADEAVLFAGAAGIEATLTGITAVFDLTGDADASTTFTAAAFELLVGRVLRIAATNITLVLNRDDTFVFTLATAEASSPLLPSIPVATLTDLVVTEQGLTLASLLFTAPSAELPGLLRLTNFRLEVLNLVITPTAAPTGTITLSADAGLLFPALGAAALRLLDDDSGDDQPAVIGLYDLENGTIAFAARRVEFTLGGVLEVVVTSEGLTPGLVFIDDPDAAADSVLFLITSAVATIPALARDGLVPSVTLTEFGALRDGTRFITSATLDVPAGYYDLIALGGVLPLRITQLAIAFPEPANLDRFDLTVTGTFDLAAFNLPFDPILYIGDPELIGTASPDLITILPGSDAEFTFALGIESLSSGTVAPIEFGPVTLGFANLNVGDAVVSGLLRLGRFGPDGQLQPLPGSPANVTGTLTVQSSSLAGLEVGATIELAGDLLRTATGGRLELTGLATLSGSGGGAVGGDAELTFELLLVVTNDPFAAALTARFLSVALTDLVIDLGFVVIRADRVEAFANPQAGDPRFLLSELSVTFAAYESLTATATGSISLYSDRIEIVGLGLDLEGTFFEGSDFFTLVNLTAQIDAVVTFTLSGGNYTNFALQSGGVTFNADSLTLFPGSTTFTAEATQLTGQLDAGTGELTFTAAGFVVTFADVLSLSLLGIQLYLGNAPNAPVFSAASATATVAALDGLAFILTDLALTRTGDFTLATATLANPGGILASFGLGGLLPFDITDVSLGFPNAGRLDGFTLSVTGAFDFTVFAGLPFTPILRIGADIATPGAPNSFTFTLALGELAGGRIAPLELGPIEIGFADLAVGGVTLGGTIIFGGFSGGIFTPTIGGSITLGAEFANASGGASITLLGTYDEASGRLAINASFTLSFTLAGKIDIENAGLAFAFTLVRLGDGSLSLETLSLTGANIGRISIRFGDLFIFQATGVRIDFNPAVDGLFATIDELSVTFPGLNGLTGTAQNFGIRADFSFAALPGFSVGLSSSGGDIFGFPDWFPVQLSEIILVFTDIEADPLDVRIILSGGISADSFPLPISGTFQGLVVDINLLRQGRFPITNLEAFTISVGPVSLFGLTVTGTLGLGLASLDAQGNLLTGADVLDDALVAQRVLFAFIQGGVSLPGLGGLDIKIGLSAAGPLLIYLSSSFDILLDPVTTLTLTGLRGGVRFGATFPSITDPATGNPDPLLLRGPAFAPATDLTPEEWLDALRGQIATIVSGNGGAQVSFTDSLNSPILIEFGATLGFAALPGLEAAVDILFSTEGKLLISGKLQYFLPAAGMTAPFVLGDAKFFLDFSRALSGSISITFLLDVPADPALITLSGFLTADVVRDAEDDIIGFTLVISGKLDVPLIGLSMEGFLRLTLTTERTEFYVSATLTYPVLGPLSAQGLLVLDYSGADTEIYGAFAIGISNEAALGPLGIAFDAGLVLRFNLSDSDQLIVFELPEGAGTINIDIPANSFALFVSGFLYIRAGDTTLFSLEGIFIIEISGSGLTIFVEASLIVGAAGPNAPPPLLRFHALGFLSLTGQGIAGLLSLELQTGFPESFGIELSATFLLRFNTTGRVVTYTPPPDPRNGLQGSTVTLSDRLRPTASPGAYAEIQAAGLLRIRGFQLAGDFGFAISGDLIEVTANASLDLAIAGRRLVQLSVNGGFRIDRTGVLLALDLSLQAGSGSADYAFGVAASFRLRINTTNAQGTINGVTLAAGIYAQVLVQGELRILGLRLSGAFGIEVGNNGFAIAAIATLELSAAGTVLFSFTVEGALYFGPAGFAAVFGITLGTPQNASSNRGAFSASFRIEINTTGSAITQIAGVTLSRALAAGPYARVAAEGSLTLGGLTFEGSFSFAVSSQFVEIDASISFRFETGPANNRTELLSFTGRAFMQFRANGVIALFQLTVSAQPNIAGLGFRLGGIFQLGINTTTTSFTFANSKPVLDAQGLVLVNQFTDLVLAANTLRLYVAGSFVTVVGGQDALTLRGSFELTRTPDRVSVRAFALVRVGPLDALRFDGAFDIIPAGVVASLELIIPGASTVGGSGFSFTGSFRLELNTTAQSQTLQNARQRVSATTGQVLVGQFDSVTLAARSFNLFVAGSLSLTASGSGLLLAGRFELRLSGANLTVLASAVLEVRAGGQRVFALAATGGLFINASGIAARFDLSLAAGGGPSSSLGFSLGAGAVFTLLLNTTGQSVTFTPPSPTGSGFLAPLTIGASPDIFTPVGPYAQISLSGSLIVAGLTLEGTFTFRQTSTTVSVSASISLALRSGNTTVFAFTGGGALLISGSGIAGQLSLFFAAGGQPPSSLGFSLSGTTNISLRLNTTGQNISSIAGLPVSLPGSLAGTPGAYAEVFFFGRLQVASVEFSATFRVRVATGGVEIRGEVTFDLALGGNRIVGLQASAFFRVNASGIAAAFDASLRAGAPGSANFGLGFSAALNFRVALNTSSTAITNINNSGANLPAGFFFEVSFGGSLTLLDSISISGGFTFRIQQSTISLQLTGSITLDLLGSFSVTGVLQLSPAGLVAALDLSAGNRANRSGGGVTFDARFTLELNTTGQNATLARPTIDRDTGALVAGTTNFSIAARTVRVTASGSLRFGSNGSLFAVHGYFQLTLSPSVISVQFDARIDLFGTRLRVDGFGALYTGANAGLVINLGLSFQSGTSQISAFNFGLGGTFRLQVNTRSVNSDGVNRNTLRVSVTNLFLNAAGFSLSGSAAFTISNGRIELAIPASDPLRVNLFGFANVSFSGTIRSDGFINLTATASIGFSGGFAGLSFSVSATATFRFARSVGGSLAFSATVSGSASGSTPAVRDPLFGTVLISAKSFSASFGPRTVSSTGRATIDLPAPFPDLVINLSNRSIAIDGPLAGATVVFDANRDGRADPGEAVTVTDQFGLFAFEEDLLALYDLNGNGVLDESEGDLLLFGGIDITTGLPFTGVLRATAEGYGRYFDYTLSPLTTLAVALREFGYDAYTAQDLIATRLFPLELGNPSVPFQFTNAFELTLLGDGAIDPDYFRQSVLLANTVAPLAALLARVSPAHDESAASSLVYRALALSLLDGPALDLGAALDLDAVLATAAELGSIDLASADALREATVAALAAANASLLALDLPATSGGSATIDLIVRHQLVTQGGIADAAREADLDVLGRLADPAALAVALAAATPPAYAYPLLPESLPGSLADLLGPDGRIVFIVRDDAPAVAATDPALRTATFAAPGFIPGVGAAQGALEQISVVLDATSGAPAQIVVRSSADGFGRVLAVIDLELSEDGLTLTGSARLGVPLAVPAGGLDLRLTLLDGADLAAARITAVIGEGFLTTGFNEIFATYLGGRSGTFAQFLFNVAVQARSARAPIADAVSSGSDADRVGDTADALAGAAALLRPSADPIARVAAAYAALYAGL